MNEIYLLLTGQIILFIIGAIYAIVQTNQVQENRPLPLIVRLVLSFSGIRILWWKRAYKSPFSKFLISVEKSTPKLSVMS